MVYQSTPQGVKTVNRLFKADFFGERALLTQEPRYAYPHCDLLPGPSLDAPSRLRPNTACIPHLWCMLRARPATQERLDCQLRHEVRCWAADIRAVTCRAASVEATTQLRCLVLARERFVDILGPLYSLMQREKSPAVVTQRLMRLQTKVERPVRQLIGGAQLLSWI